MAGPSDDSLRYAREFASINADAVQAYTSLVLTGLHSAGGPDGVASLTEAIGKLDRSLRDRVLLVAVANTVGAALSRRAW